MQRKKSRFLLFIFSFIPGAGEMYLGFMKMGVSLMLIFGVLVSIVGFLSLGFLSVFPIISYVYSFFHANHLGSMANEDFYALQDQFLFGIDGLANLNLAKEKLSGKYRKITAVTLIVVGVVMLWQAVFNLLFDIFGWDSYYLRMVFLFMRDDLPRFLIGIIIIWAGLVMIRGKKVDVLVEEDDIFVQPFHEEGQNAKEEQTDLSENRDVFDGQEALAQAQDTKEDSWQ